MMRQKLIPVRVGILMPALVFLLWCVSVRAAVLPAGFAEIQLAQGLNPTAMAPAPDGRLFLAQKDGRVLILHADGELHGEPFIQLEVDDFNERGLEGIALHPHFEQEPWVYLYYTVKGESHNRVSRVLANGDFAIPGSEQVLLELDPLGGSIHNGGAMVFGPDDNLYIGTGDGAVAPNGQSLNTVLGKILRLSAGGDIPVDNPFYTQTTGKNRAIYAYGLRNPFSMSCDPQTGRIFICDVGNGAFEEVNELKRGKNYGWSLTEGPLNGQTPPSDYQDPFFAYSHADGCAVVGAAFGFGSNAVIPAAFQGKFFFADYCKGWIKMLDPASGQLNGIFASGIDRPVSLLVTPAGELYYFARAGLGGGSPGDNTSSNEGTLWKIFWIGDGAPLVTGNPHDVLVSEGESATFRVQAFGSQPIQIDWYRNGSIVAGASGTELTLDDLSVPDSGSILLAVASNAFGTDTSAPAVLRVTSNKRPVPQISFPSVNATYHCGDTLHFSGTASDPEEGNLSVDRLSWRIDFHHADHTHPALPPVQGISEGFFVIPVIGETATDVFFRVYLTATDAQGLVRTVWRDVYPEYTVVRVNGPAGVPVNVDGQQRQFPYEFESVIGIRRTLQAAVYHQSGDTTYYFRQWSNGQTDPVLSFEAPAAQTDWQALYDTYTLGTGNGLRGEYFFDPAADLQGQPVVIRLDTTVNFDWGDGSPAPGSLPVDYFSVRWTGEVQAVFSEIYTFSVSSDDGCRLWVGDSLLIDKWVPQAATEHAGSITLQGGQKYPIRLEYFEIGGGASAQLYWKSVHQIKEIIPKRQLYEPDSVRTAAIRGTAGLDQNLNDIWDTNEPVLPNVTVSLFAAATDSLIASQKSGIDGRYAFLQLAPGAYYLRFMPTASSATLAPVGNLDNTGTSAIFALSGHQTLNFNAAWVINQAALYGSVWLDQNANGQWEGAEPGLGDITVLLYRADSAFSAATATNGSGGYIFPLVGPGNYFLLFLDQVVAIPLAPGHGLNAQARTPVFPMQLGLSREMIVAFIPDTGTETTEQSEQEGAFRIYPNPAGDYLRITWEAGLAETIRLETFDPNGRSILVQERAAVPGENNWKLEVGALRPGMYILQTRSSEGLRNRRFVKF